MADTTIRGLSAGTLAIDTAFVGQNTATGTLAEKFDYSAIGGLILASSSSDANLTATVGTLHQLTIAGLTAIRSFILPDTAAAGEIVAVYIVDGDATEEIAIKTAATGSLLQGVDHSSTAYTHLFILGEYMAFRCVNGGGAGDTDWIVIEDGRIPCSARLYRSGDVLNHFATPTTLYQIPFNATTNDNFSGADLTENHILIRRSGEYTVRVQMATDEAVADQEEMHVRFSINNDATKLVAIGLIASGTGDFQSPVAAEPNVSLAAGDTAEGWGRFDTTANLDLSGQEAWTNISVLEVFT